MNVFIARHVAGARRKAQIKRAAAKEENSGGHVGVDVIAVVRVRLSSNEEARGVRWETRRARDVIVASEKGNLVAAARRTRVPRVAAFCSLLVRSAKFPRCRPGQMHPWTARMDSSNRRLHSFSRRDGIQSASDALCKYLSRFYLNSATHTNRVDQSRKAIWRAFSLAGYPPASVHVFSSPPRHSSVASFSLAKRHPRLPRVPANPAAVEYPRERGSTSRLGLLHVWRDTGVTMDCLAHAQVLLDAGWTLPCLLR
jgi:hypothetical protein